MTYFVLFDNNTKQISYCNDKNPNKYLQKSCNEKIIQVEIYNWKIILIDCLIIFGVIITKYPFLTIILYLRNWCLETPVVEVKNRMQAYLEDNEIIFSESELKLFYYFKILCLSTIMAFIGCYFKKIQLFCILFTSCQLVFKGVNQHWRKTHIHKIINL